VHRILAVDWGERRVGVAVSDPTGLIARSLPTLEVRSEAQAVSAVLEVAGREEATRIVVGHPLNLDGSRGRAADTAERFARRLGEGTPIPVELWDERLTSAQAMRTVRETGERLRGRKGRIDARAAEHLLQSYLDTRGPRSPRAEGRPGE
jgi:putative Holliday junction resolvase